MSSDGVVHAYREQGRIPAGNSSIYSCPGLAKPEILDHARDKRMGNFPYTVDKIDRVVDLEFRPVF